MDKTASGLCCGLLAPDPKVQWFHSWAKRAAPATNIRRLLTLAGGEARTRSLDDRPDDHSVDAILMYVTRDALAWARGYLSDVRSPHVPMIAITRGLHVDAVQRLLHLGMDDFLTANCDPEELSLRLHRLCGGRRINNEAGDLSSGKDLHPALNRIVGSNTVFRQQLERLLRIAEAEVGVLILGETGTGKELFAQATHYLSRRSKAPWVALNCGALPPELIESELFGHVKGAYTSADRNRSGLVAEAEGGTLFLDEVSSLPLAAQAKLLRFLQEREYRPVGSSKSVRADVRIVAASNSDLRLMVDQGRFRKDLYYRLNVLSLSLPPLRERPDDLLPLAEHFIKRFSREYQRPVTELSRSATAFIVKYDWPGNVRELEHSLERAVLLCRNGRIDGSDLELPSDQVVEEAEPFREAKSRAVERFERLYLERMLLLAEGNITRAAELASKNRRAFWELMRKHRIDASRYRTST